MAEESLTKEFFPIRQKGYTLYLMKISVEEILKNTFVDLYDYNTEEGYQRRLVPLHYRKIARFLFESPNPIMPGAVICAIDSCGVGIDGNKITFTEKLRIVDGQHRREGFRYFFEKYGNRKDEYLGYEMPMIVLVIESNQDKIIEVETFVNINSKGKPVKTDLAVELRERLREKENSQFKSKMDFTESVAISITKICNEQSGQPWYQQIRLAEEQTIKPIGLNTFKKAMEPIVSSYVNYYHIPYGKLDKNNPSYGEVVHQIADLFIEAWMVVYGKWEEAFLNYYEYNIMKSVGIYSINQILSECIAEDGVKGVEKFEMLIENSSAGTSMWRRGGEFSGLSSSQGFKIIAERIMDNGS